MKYILLSAAGGWRRALEETVRRRGVSGMPARTLGIALFLTASQAFGAPRAGASTIPAPPLESSPPAAKPEPPSATLAELSPDAHAQTIADNVATSLAVDVTNRRHDAVAAGRVLTLRQALDRMLTSGFDVRLAQIAVDAARGDARSQAAVANPAATFGYGRALGYHPSGCDPGSTCSPNQYTVGLSDQSAFNDILSGKHGLRKELGQKSIRVASLQRDDALRLAKLALKQNFAAVVFSQARTRLAERVRQTASALQQLVQIRYNAGAPLPDLLRAQAVLLDAEQRVQAAQIQLTADRAQLALLLGLTHGECFVAEEALLAMHPPLTRSVDRPDQWVEYAQSNRPDRLAAELALEQSDAALRLAKRSRWPDIELQLGYTQQGRGNNAIQPGTLSVALSAPLPLIYQSQGQIDRATADAAARHTERQRIDAQVQNSVRASLANASASWLKTQYAAQRLERARQAVGMVQLQYQEGSTSLVDLLEATNSAVDAEDGYLDAQLGMWLQIFQLEYDSGKELVR